MEPTQRLNDAAQKIIFTEAHTHYAWLDRPVTDAQLHELWELAKMGPTGGNLQPIRLVFVRSPEAKARLLPTLMPMNVEKARTAPVTVIVAYDRAFYEKAAQVSPHTPGMGDRIASLPEAIRDRLALLSSTLQAGYLIIAARALGLDCGPMGGFDPAAIDKEFFSDGKWASTLVINLGYGDPAKSFPRQPRLSFDEACRIE